MKSTVHDRLLERGIMMGLLLTQKGMKLLSEGAEALRHAQFNLSYEARSDDIFIATYPKSGTTWVHMILYQLTTNGSMEVPHLNAFVPYLDDLLRGDVDATPWVGHGGAEQARRILKTHARYADVPKGSGRYIYVLRDGRDVAVSYYHHQRRQGYRGTFSQFFEQFMSGNVRFGSWFDHVGTWIENQQGLNILYVRFEDLLADLRGSVEQIAKFCGLPLNEAEMPRILRRCSFEFMREHEDKLDIKTWKSPRHPPEIAPEDDHFVRRGQIGQWQQLMDGQMSGTYQARFMRTLSPSLLAEGYAEFATDTVTR